MSSLCNDIVRKFSHLCDHAEGLSFFVERAIRLANDLPEEAHFVEVGTRKGGTALMLMDVIAQSTHPERWLITVDPYGIKPYKSGRAVFTQNDYDETMYRETMRRLSHYADEFAINHTHYRLTSYEFLRFKPRLWYVGRELMFKCGLVYLDGDHDIDSVYTEYQLFGEVLVDHGLLVIDDTHQLPRESWKTVDLLNRVGRVDSNRGYFYKTP